MNFPVSPAITRQRAILGAGMIACLLLAMIALIPSGTDQPTADSRARKPSPHSLKPQPALPISPSSAPSENATPSTISFSPTADGRSWDEKTALQLSDRLAELSTCPLEHMLAFVLTLPEGDFKATSWLQTLQTIATSPEASLLLASALQKTPSHLREQAWSAIAEGQASCDPAAAILWTATLPDPIARESCTQLVAARWGALEPAAALAWLDQQPADAHWEPLLQSIVISWAAARPAEAMEWAVRQSQNDVGTEFHSLTELVARVIQEQD
jgi:hypothetical protein